LLTIKRGSSFFGGTLAGRAGMGQEKLVFFKGLLEGMLKIPTDRASLESDRNFLLRIKDRERKLILKVKEALDRIDNGTFGICESCGKSISEKRLKARPVTTLCIECKTEVENQEQKERMRGTKSKSTFPS